jgi:hypothetical protein
MAAKKKKAKKGLPDLPVRSHGKRASWTTVKRLIVWLNEQAKCDPEVAIDLALAAAHAITVTTGNDPQALDERYDQLRDLLTVPVTVQRIPLCRGGDA